MTIIIMVIFLWFSYGFPCSFQQSWVPTQFLKLLEGSRTARELGNIFWSHMAAGKQRPFVPNTWTKCFDVLFVSEALTRLSRFWTSHNSRPAPLFEMEISKKSNETIFYTRVCENRKQENVKIWPWEDMGMRKMKMWTI